MSKLLTINEVAARLNVHPETLRRWGRDGKLVAIKISERGDRRYKENDVLKFINRKMTNLHENITYKNYSINWYTKGFVVVQANFHLIGQLIAKSDSNTVYFAFFEDMSTSFERASENDNLEESAISKIKQVIDENIFSDGDTYTYAFLNGRFEEKQNPEWWNGKYSKSLMPGLRVEAYMTHPTTVAQKAWRVILHFKSKQGDNWLLNTFGKNKEFTEYFVWIDSNELRAKSLPNTAKAAEIMAVHFAVGRMEETKDVDGNRDITRITENNAACFNGKCTKDSLLPD